MEVTRRCLLCAVIVARRRAVACGGAMRTAHISLLLFLLPCVLSNHYRTLGVPRSATARRSARRTARTVLSIPARRSAAAFKQLNEAHEVLGDPSKWRQYDVLGWQHHGSSTPEREQQCANEVAVFCRLDQLAGLAPVAVLVAEYPYVFSGTAWLPPGSVEGDVVRHTLRGVNIATSPEYRSIEVVLRLYELPNHRFVRHGAHLYAERALPRWHNWRAGAAYVRGLDGSRHCVSNAASACRVAMAACMWRSARACRSRAAARATSWWRCGCAACARRSACSPSDWPARCRLGSRSCGWCGNASGTRSSGSSSRPARLAGWPSCWRRVPACSSSVGLEYCS